MPVRKRPLTFLLLSLLMSFLPGPLLCLNALALDLRRVETELHRLTNQLRAERDLPPLAAMPELDALARAHSENMARQNFFSHTDPAGRSSSERMDAGLPGLLTMGSGENIAMRSSGDDALTAARALMEMWRNSPGHYANIMTDSFLQVGIGVADNGRNLYATQNFAAGLVLLEQALPAQVPAGKPVTLRFRFLAGFPAKELSIFLTVPNTQARFPSGNGTSFYVGGGPLSPVWIDEDRFEIRIPTTHGLGQYRLGIGRSGSYYSTPFYFDAVKPTDGITPGAGQTETRTPATPVKSGW